MKKILILVCILFVTNCMQSRNQSISFGTPINGCFQDYANILANSTKHEIQKICSTLRIEKEIHLALVTTPSLHGQSVEEYSLSLAQKWLKKYPQSAKSGIIILVAINARKMRIELSETASKRMSDFQAKQIIEKDFIPYFKQGKIDLGVITGVNSIKSWFLTH